MRRKLGGSGENVVYVGVAGPRLDGDPRVAVPPTGVDLLRRGRWSDGRRDVRVVVLVEKCAGANAGYSDGTYADAGAEIVGQEEIIERSHVLVGVKLGSGPKRILPNGVNVFYVHVEKGQGDGRLRAALAVEGVTLYAPETAARMGPNGKPLRLLNLGYHAGVGGARIGMEGVKLARAALSVPGPFAGMPDLDTASRDDVLRAYAGFGEAERAVRFGVIGGPDGLAPSGARHELNRIGIEPVFLTREVTGRPSEFQEQLGRLDVVVNCARWAPGDPRLIDRTEIDAMRPGTVLVDVACDEDRSSEAAAGTVPVTGGVRFSFESAWGEPRRFYWIGSEAHSFGDADPRARRTGTHVLCSACGMIPGGRSTVVEAGTSYFDMLYPNLLAIIRSVAMGAELPLEGLLLRDGLVVNPIVARLIDGADRYQDLRHRIDREAVDRLARDPVFAGG